MSSVESQLKSVNHPFFWGQTILQLGLICLAFQLPSSSGLLSGFAIVALLLVGVPHGGNDYHYRPDKTLKGSLKFLSYYLGCMALYALLWYFLPLPALLLFLAISIHHFGQSNFVADTWKSPESLLWGVWLLLFPLCIHTIEALGIFSDMMGVKLDLTGRQELGTGVLVGFGLIFGMLYAAVLWRRKIDHAWQYLLQWLLVSVWYWMSPLILGFVVVFCLWHSAQSMRYQVVYIRNNESLKTWRILMGFMPLGFLALLGWFVVADFEVTEHLALGFVLLSLVTLPHVVVMDGIYRAESHLR
jgi:Brp/Blh family beta-carotene 15,15'-monooxygenase